MSTDVHADPVTGHGDHAEEGEFGDHQHGATDKQYIVIALILAAITAAEVSISYIDIGPVFLPALLIMMAVKFFVVVSYFMHLKFDNRIFSILFYMGLFLAVGVYIGALTTFHFWSN
jgi:cytochrome c oxidase subunit IV